jgi:general secretion pathway protein J
MSRRGFTLVEVLLATAVVASLLVIVWGAVAISFDTQAYMYGTLDQYQQVRLTVDRMSRELASAYITEHANKKANLPGPEDLNGASPEELLAKAEEIEEALSGADENSRPRDGAIETAFVGKDDEMHFTSFAHVRTQENEISSDQVEISYFVRNSRKRSRDGRIRKELARREDVSLDDDVEDGGIVYVLIEDIEEVEFQYWEQGNTEDEEGGGKWIDRWDSRKSEQRGKLPTRVRIEIKVPVPETDPVQFRTFTTQAPIVMTDMLRF